MNSNRRRSEVQRNISPTSDVSLQEVVISAKPISLYEGRSDKKTAAYDKPSSVAFSQKPQSNFLERLTQPVTRVQKKVVAA